MDPETLSPALYGAAKEIRDWYMANTVDRDFLRLSPAYGNVWTGSLRDRILRAYRDLTTYSADRYSKALRAGWRIERDMTGQAPDLAVAKAQGLLPVYDDCHAHPALLPAENFLFRAVHDLYGHQIAIPVEPIIGFGLANEIKAFAAQSEDFVRYAHCPRTYILAQAYDDARAALACEIIGQAACFEIDGEFPPQRAGLLPARLITRALEAIR